MANVQKFTSANMKGLSIHLDRKTQNHSNKEIDPEKTHMNYNLCKKDGDTLSRMNQRLENVYCMKRDDVKVGCSWVVTLPSSLKEKNENEQQQFFEKTYEFLTDRYGGEKMFCLPRYIMTKRLHIYILLLCLLFGTKKKSVKKYQQRKF